MPPSLGSVSPSRWGIIFLCNLNWYVKVSAT